MCSVSSYNDVFVPKIEIVGMTFNFVNMSVQLASCDTYDDALASAKQWIEDNRSGFWVGVSIRIEKFSTTLW